MLCGMDSVVRRPVLRVPRQSPVIEGMAAYGPGAACADLGQTWQLCGYFCVKPGRHCYPSAGLRCPMSLRKSSSFWDRSSSGEELGWPRCCGPPASGLLQVEAFVGTVRGSPNFVHFTLYSFPRNKYSSLLMMLKCLGVKGTDVCNLL